VDHAFTVPDEESIKMVYRLLDDSGIYVGASSALNAAAAYSMAKQLGPGNYNTIYTNISN
jgi:cysteine synthase A